MGNIDKDFFNASYFDINALNNWWGTSNIQTIYEHIYDYYDNMSLGKVVFQPSLTSPTPIRISKIELKTDSTFSTLLTTSLLIGDTMYVELVGVDGGETTQDSTDVIITSSKDPAGITTRLIETDVNTGVYQGTATIKTSSDDLSDYIGANSGDTITIRSAADITVYDSVVVYAPNQIPVTSNVDVSGPQEINHIVDHTPTVSWNYYDGDADPQSKYTVEVYTGTDTTGTEVWDTGEVSSADTSVDYAGSLLHDGERYYLRVKTSDGKAWSAWAGVSFRMNSLPLISAVTISPDAAYTYTTLKAIPSGWSDADGDCVWFIYQWQKFISDSWQDISGATTDTLSSSYTSPGDQIKVLCTPFDGYENGTTKEASIHILETGIDMRNRIEILKQFSLYQNYPNPFNPETTIKYGLPEPSKVTIKIFNVLGQEITTLIDMRQEAGYHRIRWDGTRFPFGIYFCRMQTSKFSRIRKMLLIK